MAREGGLVSAGPQLPWPQGRRPLSLVVFGNSVSFMQMPPRSDRRDGAYVEVLADRLADEGVPTVTRLEGQWFDFLHRAMRHYETRVRPAVPDVLIVHFGLNEYQPWLMPVWMIRHLLIQNQAVTRTARGYRQYVTRPLWKRVRSYRRWAARFVGTRTWQTTPKRFAGHLQRLIRTARNEGKPLILVLDIDEPSGTLAHFLPGLVERHAIYKQTIERVVSNANDPDVRLVRVSEVTRGGGPDVLPDGMHYSPATHARVAELLTTEVVDWLKSRSS
jgi:lysophospholipase L1-like esterase